MITLTILLLLGIVAFVIICILSIPFLIIPAIFVALFFIAFLVAGSFLDAFLSIGIIYIIYRIIRAVFR